LSRERRRRGDGGGAMTSHGQSRCRLADRAHKLRRVSLLFGDQSGVVAVIVALLFVVFLGIAAFAIDIGHLMVVRNQLQNDADAAALAGASYLIPQIPSASPSPPDWTTAFSQAYTAISLNSSDGVVLTNGTVQTGYWNLAQNPAGLQGMGITPGQLDCPAVQVTVTRSFGQNGGPVRFWFAPILGINTSNISATATAAITGPGAALPGALMPIAISSAMAAQAGAYNSPATTFMIGTGYGYPMQAGQWTSFLNDASDVATMTNLLTAGNPASLNIGSNIWIEPAVGVAVYNYVPVGVNVLLPVVGNVMTHAQSPIVGFIGFHITASVGSSQYIQGYFLTDFYARNTNGAGPNYGAYAPATLVK